MAKKTKKTTTSTAPATQSKKQAGSVAVADRSPARPALFDPMERLGIGEWFDRWPDIFARRWPEAFADLPFTTAGFRMEHLVEDDGTMVVRGELPGLDPENDVTINIDNDRLTISAHRNESTEETENGTRRTEFHYGSFERSVSLPSGVRRDDVEATYENGILEVRIPCDADEESIKTIPVKTHG